MNSNSITVQPALITEALHEQSNLVQYFLPSRLNEYILIKQKITQEVNSINLDFLAYAYNPVYTEKPIQLIGTANSQIIISPENNIPPFMHLTLLRVKKEFKGHGIGHALLTLTQKVAIDNGVVSVDGIFKPHSFLNSKNQGDVSYLRDFYANHGIYVHVYKKEELVGKKMHGNFRMATTRELYKKAKQALWNTNLSKNIYIFNPYEKQIPNQLQPLQITNTKTKLLKLLEEQPPTPDAGRTL